MKPNKFLLGLIIVLSAIIGWQFYKLFCKRRENIIKLLIKKDALPAPAEGTNWIEGGACFMKDGKTGRVSGNDCMLIEVL